MKLRRAHPALSASALCLGLLACGTVPPVAAPSPPGALPSAVAANTIAHEKHFLARAEALESAGRLYEAAFAWQVVALLRPDLSERASTLKDQIASRTAERMRRARQLQSAGDAAGAEQAFLTVLAVQPDHAEAAAGLRGLERSRAQRLLGVPSRVILARRFVETPDPKPALKPIDGLEAERVVALVDQRELERSIAIAERRVANQPRSAFLKRQLADLYFRHAQLLAAENPGAARAALARCLRQEPSHAGATALLDKLASRLGRSAAPTATPIQHGEDPR